MRDGKRHGRAGTLSVSGRLTYSDGRRAAARRQEVSGRAGRAESGRGKEGAEVGETGGRQEGGRGHEFRAALGKQIYNTAGIIVARVGRRRGDRGVGVMGVAVRTGRVRNGVSWFRVDPSVERRADGENCEHQHQGRAERRGEAGGERERAWCRASHDGAEVRLRSGE